MICLAATPISDWKAYYQALVCGKKLDADSLKSLWSTLGLIHIFVVSGAHLQLLHRWLRRCTRNILPPSSLLLFLFGYVAICTFQMPILRAWIQLLIKNLSQQFSLHFNHQQNLLLSLVFCLSFNPSSFSSFSLLLSWLASLGIGCGENAFSRSFYCYLFLFPVLVAFSPVSPWTILINAFLSPIVGGLLFPMSFLSYIISPLRIPTDWLWSFVVNLGMGIESLLPLNNIKSFPIEGFWLWLYCMVLHFFLSHRSKEML